MNKYLIYLLVVLGGAIFICRDSSASSQLEKSAGTLIVNGGFALQTTDGIRGYHEDNLFVPASTIKILTSLFAIRKLGEDYRFPTHFYLDSANNLYVKGFGDPFLTSEVVLDIGRRLHQKGLSRISAIYLDDSAFSLEYLTPGSSDSHNPYDAPSCALAVNFNAVPVHIDATGTVSSGEPQTPYIPLMKEMSAGRTAGQHRLNVNTGRHEGALTPSLRYCGQLFTAQLKAAGIDIKGAVERRTVPSHLQPYLVYHSPKTLLELIRACLEFSNNFIANQLFLACSLNDSGPPATWQKAQKGVAIFAREHLDIKPESLVVVDGSGLSRENRISAGSMLMVLNHFKPYTQLLNKKETARLKTGTLNGVYCYAGYLLRHDHQQPFVILLNQKKNNRDAVLRLLVKMNK